MAYKSNKECPICNSENDEAYAGGIWDLAAEVCKTLFDDYCDEQDVVYNIIREYIEKQNYCPHCGKKNDSEG